ncbi:hypothetical protein JAO78_016505 [Alishewanella sp. 16-MA]|uniref:Uncharacterized protein n=1 Tax=Alishewanella maricola TaxID=2795740 RepID=A0ABS8C8C5_9ALTE|nr:hypothetical protein [Alishewanella maricola]MCB5228405.1 hypothetical protein [Alishewanella maricola]
MEIYNTDIASAILILLGLVVLFKKSITLTLSVGPSGTNTFVNENSKYTKSSNFQLQGIQKLLLGLGLVIGGFLFGFYVQGELAFTL